MDSHDPSQLHQSRHWAKVHVDLGDQHGCSPTLNPPREIDGVKEIARWKDLPAPYGPTPGWPGDLGSR